nr:C39 family peptidase [uncultured Methanospirillum sp.]
MNSPCCPAYEGADPPDPDAILISSVPEVIQSTRYSCGASSLQAVLRFWGFCVEERDLMTRLETSPGRGTDPEKIVSIASSYGLDAYLLQQVTTKDLTESLKQGVPVIVIAQAWNGYEENGIWVTVDPDRWDDVWNDGHYMVVIGIDSRNVYFEDPALLGTRGVIPIDEFLSRWHFRMGGEGPDDPETTYIHPGIFISGKKPAIHSDYTWIT